MADPTPMVDAVPGVASAGPEQEKVPSVAASVEHTVVLVVSFVTVTACPDVKPLPVTVTDPLAAPVGGSTRTIGLGAAEEVVDIDATASSGTTSNKASSILRPFLRIELPFVRTFPPGVARTHRSRDQLANS